MNEELNEQKAFEITSKSDAAANAFWLANIGSDIEIHVNGLGWITCSLIDVSQYCIIVLPTDGFHTTHLQVNKSAITLVKGNTVNAEKYTENLVSAVKKIFYEGKKKAERDAKKFKQNKPTFERRDNNFVQPRPTPQIVVKPKRTFSNGDA